ncbi:MAG: hypothetical protein WCF33_17235 [Pseudonocardiaceae bacterium]
MTSAVTTNAGTKYIDSMDMPTNVSGHVELPSDIMPTTVVTNAAAMPPKARVAADAR